MRFWPVLVSLALAVAALPSAARAEVPSGSNVTITVRYPALDKGNSMTAGDYQTQTNEVFIKQYLNLSRCQCDKELDVAQHVRLDLTFGQPVPTTVSSDDRLFPWTGTDCPTLTSEVRMTSCTALDAIQAPTLVNQVNEDLQRIGGLLNSQGDKCATGEVTSNYYISSSTDNGTTLAKLGEHKFVADMSPPAVPTTLTVEGLDGGLRLSWEAPTNTVDYEYYQVLCARADTGMPAKPKTHDPEYITTADVCKVAPKDAGKGEIALGSDYETNATFTAPPASLLKLDASFICGRVPGSSASIDVDKLENGTAYWVALVAVDAAGNYTAEYVPQTIVPAPVTDLWEELNDKNPELEGGMCLIESTYGGGDGGLNGALRGWRDDLGATRAGRWMVERYYAWGAPLAGAAQASIAARVALALALAPVIALALAWHFLTLPGLLLVVAGLVLWRRRSRRLALTMATATALAPALAAAQSPTPYWDDPVAQSDNRIADSHFHLGFRLGPYWPHIDDKFDMSPGPYQTLFSDGKGFLPMGDFHVLVPTSFGQLGLGISGGYFNNDAPSYKGMGNNRTLSAANRTAINLVPLELTALYRASQIDDAWGIPIVPYLRGGLGYYIWWITTNDAVAQAGCDAGGNNCTDRAVGASLGLVGAAGLAIRAERIDAEAARSMRENGIEHSGFYAEVSTAWVDGFGNEKKMSLGDTTWFAGIDFEF